jgi:hypothetical protein
VNELLIKYFSARMLLTLDMDQLFRSLLDQFGECQISFVPMTAQERAQASTDLNGIEAVNERFWVFHRVGAEFVRQRDIEETIVRLGQK